MSTENQEQEIFNDEEREENLENLEEIETMEEDFTEDIKEKKFGRRLAREEIFKIVFEAIILSENLEDSLSSYKNRDESVKTKDELTFIEETIKNISQNYEEIENAIISNMDNWDLKRIGNVERTLLIIASYEILKTNTPKAIAINEAIELAKEFGDVKSHEFINGVLARIVKSTY